MINDLRFSERNPFYGDEAFEIYKTDVEEWRNFQVSDQNYNSFPLESVVENTIIMSNETNASRINNKNKKPENATKSGASGSSKTQIGNPANLPVVIEQRKQNSLPIMARKHSREPHYPQRGNTDPFRRIACVY